MNRFARCRAVLRSGAGAFLVLTLGAGARAGVVSKPTLESLARRATAVVEGEVLAVGSAWDPDGLRIHTTVEIRVAAEHKGGSGASRLTIRYLGGSVGEITQAVLGQPSFASGEQVFLYLAPNFEAGEFPLVDGEYGKFTLASATRPGEKDLRSPLLNASRASAIGTIDRILRNAGLEGKP